MSTNERDELDELPICRADRDPWTGREVDVWLVKHSDARRIVDSIKAKLDAVTRERDEARDSQYWIRRYNEVVDKLNVVRDELAQAREQLATAQAEAAAMSRIMDENESRLNDLMRRIGVAADVGWIRHELRYVLRDYNGTTGRELLEEVRRKDDEIRSLKERQQHLVEAGARYKRKGRTAKAALVEARERIAELEAQIRDGVKAAYDAAEKEWDAKEWADDQPTPEPVEQADEPLKVGDWVEPKDDDDSSHRGELCFAGTWVKGPFRVAAIETSARGGIHLLRLEGDGCFGATWDAGYFRRVRAPSAEAHLLAIARELRELLTAEHVKLSMTGLKVCLSSRIVGLLIKLRDEKGGAA